MDENRIQALRFFGQSPGRDGIDLPGTLPVSLGVFHGSISRRIDDHLGLELADQITPGFRTFKVNFRIVHRSQFAKWRQSAV